MSKGGWHGRWTGTEPGFYTVRNAWVEEYTKNCHLCGKVALYRVGRKGYCKAHKGQAFEDRARYQHEVLDARTEAVEALRIDFDKRLRAKNRLRQQRRPR